MVFAEDEVDREDTHRFSLCLAGRLWIDSSFNSGALQSTIRQIWRLKNGVKIREIVENLFSFQFFDWKDKERVFQGEPWWFDKKILVLYEIKGVEQPSTLKPYKTPIWVGVYDTPFILRTERVIGQIGNVIGEFLGWDNTGEGKWGRFLRLRVLVDLNKPLKKGTILRSKEGAVYKISFKFGRLMDLCYICGKVGHLLKDCNEKDQDDTGDSSNLTFGPWMRASPTRMRQNLEKEEDKVKKNCKMIFKPEPKFGESDSPHQPDFGSKGKLSTTRVDRGLAIRREGEQSECWVISDPGTDLNEIVLNPEQAKILNLMLDSLIGCHISAVNLKGIHGSLSDRAISVKHNGNELEEDPKIVQAGISDG